jgi:hypothetical protein
MTLSALNFPQTDPTPIFDAFTEGRAYSAAGYRMWSSEVGLVPGELVPTLVHCGVLPAAR